MKKKTIKQNILLIVLFIFQPLLWLIFGIAEIANNKRLAYIKLAILLGMFGYVLFPWGDGFERYKFFTKIGSMDHEEFLFFLFFQIDYFFYILSYIFNYFNLEYQYIQFFFVVSGYLLVFSLFRKNTFSSNVKLRIILFLLLMCLINFLALANNLRYALATIVFLYGIYDVIKYDKAVRGYIFILLSFSIHFYTILLFVIFYLSKIFFYKINSKTLILLFKLSFLIGFVNIFLIQEIARFVIAGNEGVLFRKIASYILGGDGTITHMISSVPQLMHHIINLLPLVFLIIYFLKYRDWQNDFLIKLFFIFLSINNLFIYSFSLFLRLEYFIMLLGLFSFISHYTNAFKHSKLFLQVFIFVSFVFISIQFIYFKKLIAKDNHNYINSTSVKIIFTSPLFLSTCKYSDKEIYDGNKNFMILKEESLKRTMKTISNN
jgi:hypothetical protein